MKLEDLSPLAGIMTGKGAMGSLARSGALGIAPAAISRDAYKDAEEERQRKESESKGMKKGGKVSSASKRADGCAQRGKTKGRFV